LCDKGKCFVRSGAKKAFYGARWDVKHAGEPVYRFGLPPWGVLVYDAVFAYFGVVLLHEDTL
jgi:hypothetical protein